MKCQTPFFWENKNIPEILSAGQWLRNFYLLTGSLFITCCICLIVAFVRMAVGSKCVRLALNPPLLNIVTSLSDLKVTEEHDEIIAPDKRGALTNISLSST